MDHISIDAVVSSAVCFSHTLVVAVAVEAEEVEEEKVKEKE